MQIYSHYFTREWKPLWVRSVKLFLCDNRIRMEKYKIITNKLLQIQIFSNKKINWTKSKSNENIRTKKWKKKVKIQKRNRKRRKRQKKGKCTWSDLSDDQGPVNIISIWGENFFRFDQKFRFISILARIKLESGDSGWNYEEFRILNSRFSAEYKVSNVNHMIISV